ncbi:MAG TPA: hypothetical protein VKW76_03235 [Candidatus Binatia bacterium]|nr:hypothetical protein [Candidatus Binatia bacterium]
MRRGTLTIGAAMLLATASVGVAGGVNCKQVLKYLQTGRSVSDVAETMVISEEDVKKCQEQAPAAQGNQGTSDTSKGSEGSEKEMK